MSSIYTTDSYIITDNPEIPKHFSIDLHTLETPNNGHPGTPYTTSLDMTYPEVAMITMSKRLGPTITGCLH